MGSQCFGILCIQENTANQNREMPTSFDGEIAKSDMFVCLFDWRNCGEEIVNQLPVLGQHTLHL
jgi:hypothetical protein